MSYPLVSIVIPTYKSKFFTQSLFSALMQTYENKEIIVSDNCPDNSIFDVCINYSKDHPLSIEYHRSDKLGSENIQNCFDLANGEYVKFLFDDDLLDFNCVEKMVGAFESAGLTATLVTSIRDKIDENGKSLSIDCSTQPLFPDLTIVNGINIGNFILYENINVIGEFTSVMFRKKDLIDNKPFIYSFGDYNWKGLTDVSTWLYLLAKGNLIYIPEKLSSFRIHALQNTMKDELQIPGIIEWYYLIKEANKFGFLVDESEHKQAIEKLLITYDAYLLNSFFSDNVKTEIFKFIKKIRKEESL